MKRNRILGVGLALVFVGASALYANHSWGGYHWARTSNPFTLKVGNNVSSTWSPYLNTTVSDWSVSDVLDLTLVAGGTKPRNCRPTAGRVEVCNASYGNTGWLGVASISITGGTHITQGTVKLNDTYFNTATYNTPAWRNLVTCQEVGHTLGLDHQDETFNNPNLGTCMDYTNDPSTNQHPNAHDYEELDIIYAHLDSTTTVGAAVPQPPAMSQIDLTSPASFGPRVRTSADGRTSTHVLDFGRDHEGVRHLIVSYVFWAEPLTGRRP